MSVTAKSLQSDRRDKKHSRLSKWISVIDHSMNSRNMWVDKDTSTNSLEEFLQQKDAFHHNSPYWHCSLMGSCLCLRYKRTRNRFCIRKYQKMIQNHHLRRAIKDRSVDVQFPQLLRLLRSSRRHRNRSWHSHCEWHGHIVKLTEETRTGSLKMCREKR